MNLALANMGVSPLALANYNSLAGMTGGLNGSAMAAPLGGIDFSGSFGMGGDMSSLGAPGMDMGGAAGGAAGAINPVMAGLDGLKTVAGIWNAFQAQKMAKKQFKFTKQMTRANLANQVKSYNTALADRARSRGYMEGQSQDKINSYVSANSLHTRADDHNKNVN